MTFTLDGREVTARKGEVIISAAERAGTFIPRFCYHPRMEPVGVCRMCLVEVSGPRGATLQPACFVEATEGAEVVTDSEKVKKAQNGVLEFLLVNHPLDCPVCDKGGECPLQDQTLAYGPGESRFVEEKRHFEKPIPISDLVLLDRERCIQCSRCTRFAAEVAGEAQIDFIGRGEQVQVNTFPDLPFTSYFSGNTVQICPVGALTAEPYRFTARPWDLDQVESTCTACSVGCRIVVQSSADRVTRLLGIDADPVNHGWLCDKGRFGFESVNADERVSAPMVRVDGELVATTWFEALRTAAAGLRHAASADGPEAIGVIGGARLTNEGAYAWARLAKGVLGTDSVDAQLDDGLDARVLLGLPRATIDEAASARTVVLLGGDVREELPVLFLRLRAAAASGRTNLIELSTHATSLTALARATLRCRPGDVGRLAEALVDGSVPAPDGCDVDALTLARDLVRSGDVVVVAGRPSLAEDGAIAAAAAAALCGLEGARVLSGLRRGNVHGAIDMGLAPGVLPGRTTLGEAGEWFAGHWGRVPEAPGRTTREMLESAAGRGGEGPRVRALVLLGSEPEADVPDHRLAVDGVAGAEFVVAVTSTFGPASRAADVVLPAAETFERGGTTTNLEGRVSRLGRKLTAPGQAWADWMIAAELAGHLGQPFEAASEDELWDEIERVAPAYAGLTRSVIDAPGARDGVVVPLRATPVEIATGAPLDPIALPGVQSVERQGAPARTGAAGGIAGGGTAPGGGVDGARPPVISAPVPVAAPRVAPTDNYSFRLVAERTLYDEGTMVDATPHLAGLVETAALRLHPHDLDDLGVAPGSMVRLRTPDRTAVVSVAADPTVLRHVAVTTFRVPFGEGSVGDLIDSSVPVTELRLESL